jgi:hypothetical protein
MGEVGGGSSQLNGVRPPLFAPIIQGQVKRKSRQMEFPNQEGRCDAGNPAMSRCRMTRRLIDPTRAYRVDPWALLARGKRRPTHSITFSSFIPFSHSSTLPLNPSISDSYRFVSPLSCLRASRNGR